MEFPKISTIPKLLRTDGYKLSHAPQYPPNTTKIYSYLESRGGKFDATIFSGLEFYVKEYLQGVFVTAEEVDYAEKFSKIYFGADYFNKEGWMHIVNNHGGKLPLEIKAVKEGTLVGTKNVLMTIENTDPKCFWLTNYMETLLMKIWYSTTIATHSHYCKKLIKKYLDETHDNSDSLPFKLVDFGARGVSCCEQAGIGGMSHLVSFMSTDTLEGVLYAIKYYNAPISGFSIGASEHSTITSWGKENESKAYLNMLEKYPTGLVACVSDSYDIYNACEKIWGEELKEKVLARDGCLVIRPDSGDPLEVLSKILDILWNKFGGTYNSKVYKVLDSHVRIIQGDGIDYEMIGNILEMMKTKKFSAENMAFGSGGGLLQKFDRDTQKFAIKCSMAIINGKEVNVSKQPITQTDKKSKQGRLILHPNSLGGFRTFSSAEETPAMFNSYVDALETVFLNGELVREQTFEEIRKIADSYL